jgi:hypothetical protein
MAMGDGTLPLESFKGYIIQDYLYLVSLRIPITIDVELINVCRFISRVPTLLPLIKRKTLRISPEYVPLIQH